jgi:hypothetical protein
LIGSYPDSHADANTNAVAHVNHNASAKPNAFANSIAPPIPSPTPTSTPTPTPSPDVAGWCLTTEMESNDYGTPLPLQLTIKKITHITRKRKSKSFAIPADATATPPKPTTAAMRAMIRKVIAKPNIFPPPFRYKSHQQIAVGVL